MNTMAIDQFNNTYHIGPRPPRKFLLAQFGRSKAEKTYRDRNGKSVHVGYLIAGHWLEIYRVEDWK